MASLRQVLTLGIIVISVVATFPFLSDIFLSTAIAVIWILVIWNGSRNFLRLWKDNWNQASVHLVADVVAGFAAFILYQVLTGFSIIPGSSPTPRALLFFLAVILVIGGGGWNLLNLLESHLGGSLGYGKYLGVAVILLIIVYFIFSAGLGGSLANLSAVAGPAGGAIDALGGVANQGIDTVATNFSPHNNRQIARMQCMMEMGGITGAAFTPSTAVSDCVRRKISGGQPNATSERVTDPVQVDIGEVEVEPFSDEVEARVPLTNTLVYDRRGVPIDMPAKDVNVDVVWSYEGNEVKRMEYDVGDIPSGATKLASGEDLSASAETVNNESINDNQILSYLRQYASGENQEEAKDWLESAGDKDRIALVAAANDIDTVPEMFDSVDSLIAGEDYEYSISIRADYDYNSVEAAFTDSSRWQSGNHLLEVWRPEAWRDLSLEEREAWKDEKCSTITKVGQEFERQRTAALTTPVTPVMYARCGISLFRNVEGGKGEIPITVGVEVNDDSSQLDPGRGFTVKRVETDCRGGEMEGVPGISGSSFDKDDGRWVSDGSITGTVDRDIEDIAGERRSIACRVNMSMTLNLEKDYGRYTVPVIG